MLFVEKTLSFFLPKDVSYKTYYCSNLVVFPHTLLQKVLLKRNPFMNTIIYDDGMGTYNKSDILFHRKKLHKIAEKLLGWNLDDPQRTRMMSYVPELTEPPEYLKGITVEQQPRLSFDEATRKMLKDVFDVGENSKIKEKYIIFDVPRPYPAERVKVLDNCYDTIIKLVDTSEIICKPHPRSQFNTNVDVKIYSDYQIPMEILYASMEDLEDRVLISFVSTAIFTPKILFDKEPKVISLHRILNYMPFEQTFEKFRGIYRNKERVIAPNSIEELADVIKAF